MELSVQITNAGAGYFVRRGSESETIAASTESVYWELVANGDIDRYIDLMNVANKEDEMELISDLRESIIDVSEHK